jgi:chorismate mutase/prephenate dehydratase
MDDLHKLRQRIDELDDRILELLNDRARVVLEIGKAKLDQQVEFRVPAREQEICRRLESANPGPFPNEALRAVYREIFSASLSLERPLHVAYLGPKATFTHQACLQHFGFSAQYLPVHSIKEVFDEVERGRAQYGVVPVENSTEGVVNYTLDMFIDSELKITAEILLEVTHHLMNRSGRREEIRKIYSHPQAAAQCRQWLEGQMPETPILEVSSTAHAAELAAEEPAAAAIAGEMAAMLYGLEIVQRRIEDQINNFTRFLIIGEQSPPPTGNDKTSIMFSIKDRVGALFTMLEPFAMAGINLTRLDARPSRKRVWDYVFFLDLEGHAEEENVRAALERLRQECLFLKVLGSYPREGGKA